VIIHKEDFSTDKTHYWVKPKKTWLKWQQPIVKAGSYAFSTLTKSHTTLQLHAKDY
jgi:hypothetical protein